MKLFLILMMFAVTAQAETKIYECTDVETSKPAGFMVTVDTRNGLYIDGNKAHGKVSCKKTTPRSLARKLGKEMGKREMIAETKKMFDDNPEIKSIDEVVNYVALLLEIYMVRVEREAQPFIN